MWKVVTSRFSSGQASHSPGTSAYPPAGSGWGRGWDRVVSQPLAHPAGMWSPSSPFRLPLSLGFLLGLPQPHPTFSAFPSLQRDLDPGSALSDADMVPLLLLPLLWGGEWQRVGGTGTGWGGAEAAAEVLCPPRVPAGAARV